MAGTQDSINQDRNYITGQGNFLNQEQQDRARNEKDKRIQSEAWLQELYGGMTTGGGYTPEQQEAIIREQERRGNLTTEGEFQGNYLTPEEQAAIMGDPNAAMQYFNRGNFDTANTVMKDTQGAAIDGMQAGYDAAIDPTKMAYSKQAITDPRTALNRENLTQSAGLADKVRLTPEQQQEMVTGAGISEGVGYRAAIGRLERQGRAAGVDPLGVAAMKSEMEAQSAGQAGDAMTQARIRANAEGANREMSLEQQRLAAEQGYAGMSTSAINAANAQAIQQEAQRAGSEQNIAGQRAGAVSDVGRARISTASDQARNQLQTEQYLQDTQMDQATQADAAGVARAGTVATNRQGVNASNAATGYGQRTDLTNDLSTLNQTAANMQKQEQQEARGYVQNKWQNENANEQSDYDRQSGLYTGRGSMQLSSTGQQANWDMRPKTWEKVAGMAIGAAGAAMGAGGIRGGGKAAGGIVTEPTYAMVGENGPEAIVPLGDNSTGTAKMNMNKLPRQNFSYGPAPEATQMAPSPGPSMQPGAAAQPDYLQAAPVAPEVPQTGGLDFFPGQVPQGPAGVMQGPPQTGGVDPFPTQSVVQPQLQTQGYGQADPVKGNGWQKPPQGYKTAMPVKPNPMQPGNPQPQPTPQPAVAGYASAMKQKAPQPMTQKKQPQYGPSIRQDRMQQQPKPQPNYLA